MVLFAILNASQLFNNLTFIGFYNMLTAKIASYQ